MYVPKQFEEVRAPVLEDAIRSIGLATLITAAGGVYHATHVPMVLARRGADTVLECHMARPNPHLEALDAPALSLAVFQGPHAYISPAWYASKREHGKVVPTWNYIAVHVRGTLARMDEWHDLARHLNALTDQNEAGRSEPWSVADAPEAFIAQMMRGIVGLRFTVQRMEGAWKMIQHKPDADRKGTADGLAASAHAGDREVAEILRRLEAERQP